MVKNKFHKAAALILAGGKSERMGYPKLWLEWRNVTLLENLIQGYRKMGINRIVAVVNETYMKGGWQKQTTRIRRAAELIRNPYPEKGRFYSLCLGMNVLQEEDFVFLHPVDNPWVFSDVIHVLWSHRNSGPYIYPAFDGAGGHPGLMSGKIIPAINKEEEPTQIHLRDYLKSWGRIPVIVQNPGVTINLNTPEDAAAYFITIPSQNEGVF